VAFGVGALVAASEVAFVVLKVVGCCYLVYLGVQTIRHRRAKDAWLGDTKPQPLARVFFQAMLVGATNPKTLAFFVAILPQFVDPHAGPASPQIGLLGLMFALLAFCFDSLCALAAGTARDWFARSPRRLENLSAAGGGLMIALAGVLAFARRTA
jgi:threonine/homoserine/homoserine lactone efflux protein